MPTPRRGGGGGGRGLRAGECRRERLGEAGEQAFARRRLGRRGLVDDDRGLVLWWVSTGSPGKPTAMHRRLEALGRRQERFVHLGWLEGERLGRVQARVQ